MGHLLGKHEWKSELERAKKKPYFDSHDKTHHGLGRVSRDAGMHCARVVGWAALCRRSATIQGEQGDCVQFQFESATAHNMRHSTQRHKSMSMLNHKIKRRKQKKRERKRKDEGGWGRASASCQLTLKATAQNSITHIGYGYAALWGECALLWALNKNLRITESSCRAFSSTNFILLKY